MRRLSRSPRSQPASESCRHSDWLKRVGFCSLPRGWRSLREVRDGRRCEGRRVSTATRGRNKVSGEWRANSAGRMHAQCLFTLLSKE